MVCEIRDAETAEIAIQAALTGHLVFSTLHTNDAAGAISRLLEMGVEDYLLASSLLGVMAQRLVRRLCPDCKQPVKAGAKLAGELSKVEDSASTVYDSGGCPACSGTGFRGRCGIYELLQVDDSTRAQILSRASAGDIKSKAVKSGMRTLRDDGWRTVKNGVTSVAEVLRVTQDEGPTA
jgi:general secretion pathway protein E